MDAMSAQSYRFDIAFSFAGTHRERVRAIAEIVQGRLGQGVVFYDEWFEDELNGDDADVFLQNCYEKRALMVIADVSEDYSGRRWPQAEARAIRALRMTIDTARDEVSRLRLAYIRFAEGDVPGVHATAITWDALKKSDEELAELILSRLQKLKDGLEIHTFTAATLIHPSLFQLPPVKANFTGRETDLAALRDLDARGGGTAAVITGLGGMGGIGKSELAKVLAHEWRPRFPDAQIWLDGYGTRTDPPPPSAGDLIAQVIRAFHPEAGQLPEDVATLQALYRQSLEGKKALIVLDNAAHPEVADQAGPLVPPEGCGLIVTSRRSFLVGGKAPYTVGRLPEPEAIALLREICPELEEVDATAVAARCGGLPLALRLAGAHFLLDGASPPAVASYLAALAGGRLATLDADAADAGEVTIQETLRLSVDPLSVTERAAWLRLGVFAGSFDAAAARVVAGEAADPALLNGLVRRNLLERDLSSGGGERYRLHDLAADYGRHRLGEEEGKDALNAAHLFHAGYYATVGQSADGLYLAGDPLAGMALFDRERVQIEAGFAWLAAHPDGGAADRVILAIVNAVVYASELRFHPQQSISWFEAQAAAALRLDDREAEGNALGNLGSAHRQMGNARGAIAFYERALAIDREIGNRLGEGADLGNLGNAHFQLGESSRALECYEKSLEIYREFGDRRGEANALSNLGAIQRRVGGVRHSIEYFEKALEIDREIGNRRGEGTDLGNLGVAHRLLGDARRAIGFYEQQLEIVCEIGDRRGESAALGNLGNAHLHLDDARAAIGYYEQQLEIVRETGDRRGESCALWNAALAHRVLGEQRVALARAEAALAICEAIEDPNAEKVRSVIAIWRGSER